MCREVTVLQLDMQATKDVLAMASLEVDLNKIEPGQTITVKWRGKPVFIKRRTDEDIAYARDVDVSTLRDPQTDEERTQNPEVKFCHNPPAFSHGISL